MEMGSFQLKNLVMPIIHICDAMAKQQSLQLELPSSGSIGLLPELGAHVPPLSLEVPLLYE